MATIRAYTTIEQSRKLAKILPLESADMFLVMNGTIPVMSKYLDEGYIPAIDGAIPCWSLAALLGVLPDYTLQTNTDGTVFVVCESKKPIISDAYDNPLDACVAMIEKLNELKML